MTKSFRIPVVVLCAVFVFASHAHAEPQLKKLQGTWTGTEVGHEDEGEVTLEIDGNKIRFDGWHQEEWYKGTIEVAEQNDRRLLFAKVTECPVEAFNGKTSNGIYKLEDDTLTIAARAPGDPDAPKDFDDEGSRSFVLKKRK